MLSRRILCLLLTLFMVPLAQAAETPGERCVDAVAQMEEWLWDEGNKTRLATYKGEVWKTYNLCRTSDAPADAKIKAYKERASFERDRKISIAMLMDGADELSKRHGSDSPELLPLLLHLGLLVADENREEGTAILERALAIQKKHYGESSEAVADGYLHLATVAVVAEDLTLAEQHYRTAIAVAQKACGPECSTLALAIMSLTDVVKRDPLRAAEAEGLERQWVEATPKERRRKQEP